MASFATAVVLAGLTTDTIRAATEVRTLSVYNIHTKETVHATFKRDGEYVEAGLDEINHIMRDWRVDVEIDIDPKLVDLLWELHTELGVEGPIHVISGHRSEQTNDMLRRTRGGQAKKSLHILGQAADVHFPGVSIERLRNAALVRQRGGVGYYPRSGVPFVHVDTGRVRHWPAIPEAQLASIMSDAPSAPPSASNDDPVTQIAERASSLVAQILETPETPAPAPRFKPQAEDAAPAPTPVVVAEAGESALEPSRRETAGGIITSAGRDWGQSWLLPTAATAPRQAPPAGASRVVASATPPSAPPSAKSDTPLNAVVAAGYAAPVVDEADRVAGLLDSSADDLSHLLAEARRLDEQAGLDASRRGAVDLRPAVLVHSRVELPSTPRHLLPPPVITASLGPSAVTSSYARIDRAPTASLGSSTLAPGISPVLEAGPRAMASLLVAPLDDHRITFEPRHPSGPVSHAAFAAPDPTPNWRATRREAAASEADVAGELVAFAERAFGWIFGN